MRFNYKTRRVLQLAGRLPLSPFSPFSTRYLLRFDRLISPSPPFDLLHNWRKRRRSKFISLPPPCKFSKGARRRFKYNAIIPRARKRMTESRMIHQSRAVSAELIRGRSVHGFSRFSNVSIETLTFHRSPERRIQLAIREE